MPYKSDVIIIKKENKKSSVIFWIFFGIIGFLAIYFPLFGSNLRFQTGALLSKAFTTVGTILVTFGALMFVWGLFTLFCGKSGSGVKVMILGFVMVFLGSYFINPALLGVGSTGKEVPKGYH